MANLGRNKNWLVFRKFYHNYHPWAIFVVYSNGTYKSYGSKYFRTLQAAKKSAGPLMELIESNKQKNIKADEHWFLDRDIHEWDWRVER